MHRLAHAVVSAKRKRNVTDPAADLGQGQRRLDDARGLDEAHCVVVVLIHAGSDGKDVRIKNNVLRWKTYFARQQIVRTRTNLNTTLCAVGLALLVERHHYNCRAVPADQPRLLEEHLLTFLEADRVDDSLALHAFETGLDDRPFRAVDHDRHARDVRLRGDQIQESHHRRLGVEHALIHVDVDDLRTVLDLLQGDRQRLLVLIVLDQLGKTRRAGNVVSLSDVYEI